MSTHVHTHAYKAHTLGLHYTEAHDLLSTPFFLNSYDYINKYTDIIYQFQISLLPQTV